MAACLIFQMLRQVRHSPLLACRLPTARPVAHRATASQLCTLRRPDLVHQHTTCRPDAFKRSVVTRAAVNALDEFEFDDEEPMERRQIAVGEEEWAQAVYGALSEFIESPAAAELDVFLFKTTPDKRVEIRIDKLTDKYGSPTLGDLQNVTAAVNSGVLEKLGEDLAGEIEVAVSSPGAERPVEWDELQRFSQLPLWVVFTVKDEQGEAAVRTHVLEIVEMAEEGVTWQRADVRANSPGKGRKMNKKMREERWTLHESDIQGMRIYVDF